MPDVRYCSSHHSSVRNGTLNKSATSFWKRPSLTNSMQLVFKNRSRLPFLRVRARSCSNMSCSYRVESNPFMVYHETSSHFQLLLRACSALRKLLMVPVNFKARHYNDRSPPVQKPVSSERYLRDRTLGSPSPNALDSPWVRL